MKKSDKTKEKGKKPVCPYCEVEVVSAEFPFCQPCGVTLHYCVTCRAAVAREAETCPVCGGELEWKQGGM
ncbi:MAG: hypothetical protein A2Y91_01435 [Chloroflexi bacterium RBG_13_54_8]|nr:MAG: hypothetical protein A2Y91_01435 [Chloroflexi bacterium RBG_13_54_8]